ncbi:serine/threonine-protein kinase [Streptosporangium roseum]|uniref:Serine/threonine protein kinase n=1 Tax=Streptosporangium roseum (strain ATCC 12428 / DSM 43021 / JCM 3005 / KCTC 9067 / NCIMB 10171 / NRRL 2505 / NI 9100) TaxID=479432 RepID=D2ATX7_STRRD|nr:serine/threonine-protein kinase [Streptosporangium roseum]ACZ88632.1 serine/threonine protein kinase [Streptosporangium roseum DSM 43021]
MEGIADYEFVRSLGAGNHGEFYLARKPDRLPVEADYVAVKVVGGTGGDAFRRATRELKAFAAVRSPYLVTLYDAGQQGGVFYYSMEYLPGGSLGRPAEPPTRERALRSIACVAHAAQALHEEGIVHRDIRPGNVLLTDAGGKLSDLGLSQVLMPGVTVTGMGDIGSVEFTDPALLQGETPTPAGDVWSLGATLHWAVTRTGLYGELPVHDPLLTLRKVYSTPPSVHADLEPELSELVHACIGDAAKRPTAGGLADRLYALVV